MTTRGEQEVLRRQWRATACKLQGKMEKEKDQNKLKNATMKLMVSMIMKMFTNLESFQGYNIKGRTIFFYSVYIIIPTYFEKMCFLMWIIFKLRVLGIRDVHMHPQRPEKLESCRWSHRHLRAPWCRCWDPNSNLVQEKYRPLTTEPSFQSIGLFYVYILCIYFAILGI